MRDEVHFDSITETRSLNRLAPGQYAYSLFGREDVNAPEIVVGIGRWKTIEVCSADRCEEQRVRMAMCLGQQNIEVSHCPYSGDAAIRLARISNSFAPS